MVPLGSEVIDEEVTKRAGYTLEYNEYVVRNLCYFDVVRNLCFFVMFSRVRAIRCFFVMFSRVRAIRCFFSLRVFIFTVASRAT
jgi:hypothetical protein